MRVKLRAHGVEVEVETDGVHLGEVTSTVLAVIGGEQATVIDQRVDALVHWAKDCHDEGGFKESPWFREDGDQQGAAEAVRAVFDELRKGTAYAPMQVVAESPPVQELAEALSRVTKRGSEAQDQIQRLHDAAYSKLCSVEALKSDANRQIWNDAIDAALAVLREDRTGSAGQAGQFEQHVRAARKNAWRRAINLIIEASDLEEALNGVQDLINQEGA